MHLCVCVCVCVCVCARARGRRYGTVDKAVLMGVKVLLENAIDACGGRDGCLVELTVETAVAGDTVRITGALASVHDSNF